jgi:hypothetical protein
MSSFKLLIITLGLSLSILFSATTISAQSKILRADATNPASSSAMLLTVLGKIYPLRFI